MYRVAVSDNEKDWGNITWQHVGYPKPSAPTYYKGSLTRKQHNDPDPADMYENGGTSIKHG